MTESDQSGEATTLSIQSTRKQLVSLYVTGSKTDAQALFGAIQGATEENWVNFERILDPVWRFVNTGDLPYMGASVVAEPESEGLTPPADPDSYHANQETTEPVDVPDSSMTAAELISRAQVATTDEDLDLIEGAANGRVTVLDAVEARREALTQPA
jgi:hypothetical protein